MHIAIIMDGNGRWALRQRLPRTAGHRAGADAVNTDRRSGGAAAGRHADAVRVLGCELAAARG